MTTWQLPRKILAQKKCIEEKKNFKSKSNESRVSYIKKVKEKRYDKSSTCCFGTEQFSDVASGKRFSPFSKRRIESNLQKNYAYKSIELLCETWN